MVKNLVSLLLLLVSAFLSLKHGWDSLHLKSHPESAKMMAELGIKPSYAPALGLFSATVGLLLLFPKTFFLGNVLHALSIVVIMALALHAGHARIALLEVPFLLVPLVLVWLKYPFAN